MLRATEAEWSLRAEVFDGGCGQATVIESQPQIPHDTFRHVALTITDGPDREMALLIMGAEVATMSLTDLCAPGAEQLNVGNFQGEFQSGPVEDFNHIIDELRISDVVRTFNSTQ